MNHISSDLRTNTFVEPFTIDLAEHLEEGARVLAGQDNGKAVRAHYRLDVIDALLPSDAVEGLVTIKIPDVVISFNSSFFLGMLSKSVIALGAEEFRRRYHFSGPDAERTRENGIRISQLTATPLRTLRRETA